MRTTALLSPLGVAAWGDQLIVSDRYRLAFWNGMDGLESGQAPSGMVGDTSLGDFWDPCCARIKADKAGRLWVLDAVTGAWLDVYQLPLN